MNRSFIIILTMLISLMAQAQVKNANTHYFNLELLGQMTSFAKNPAHVFYVPDSTYSDVSLQWDSKRYRGLHNVQLGNHFTDRRFDANALRLNSKTAVYGQASYQNGHTDGIKWNTAADLRTLYPYVVADTIGGTSYHEYYTFMGGYAIRLGKFTIGGEGHYRSGLTYRKLDPRPKNTISDLTFTLGATMPLARHRLGFNLGIKSYKQSQSVGVYRPGSGIKLFYMRGMGMSDASFSTVITNGSGSANYYDSFAGTFALQLYPEKNNGMYYSVSYRPSTMELSNSFDDLVHELKKDRYRAEIGHQSVNRKHTINIKAFAQVQLHDGYEYNYDRGRKLISVSNKYQHNTMDAGVSGIYTSRYANNKRFFVQAQVHWLSNSEEYKVSASSPKALQEFTLLNPGVSLGADWQWQKSYLCLKLQAAYWACLDTKLQTSNLAATTANSTLVVPNYNYLTSDKLMIRPSLRYSHQITNKSDLYLQGEYRNISFENGKPSQGFKLAAGFVL